MTAHRWRGDLQGSRQIAGRAGPLREDIYDTPPLWIGERRERSIQAHNLSRILYPLPALISSIVRSATGWLKVQTWPSGSAQP